MAPYSSSVNYIKGVLQWLPLDARNCNFLSKQKIWSDCIQGNLLPPHHMQKKEAWWCLPSTTDNVKWSTFAEEKWGQLCRLIRHTLTDMKEMLFTTGRGLLNIFCWESKGLFSLGLVRDVSECRHYKILLCKYNFLIYYFSSKHFTTKWKTDGLQMLLLFPLKPKDLQTTRQ